MIAFHLCWEAGWILGGGGFQELIQMGTERKLYCKSYRSKKKAAQIYCCELYAAGMSS